MSEMNQNTQLSWITSWYASPEPVWGEEFPFPTKLPSRLFQQTIRQIARMSLGGGHLRIELSNEYGNQPLVIGGATAALMANDTMIHAESLRVLTFSGSTSVTIPPHATVLSDPVALHMEPLGLLGISLFLPEESIPSTFHWDARQTTYMAQGDHLTDVDFPADQMTDVYMYIKSIMVDAPDHAGTIVAIGDSITDGAGSTLDANTRWTNFLADQLATRRISVLNAGISGGRLLRNVKGRNVLARFDRDVLSQPNIHTVIVIIGTNDIGMPGMMFAPTESAPAADELIAGYRQLITRAHARKVRIIGGTLPPFELYDTEAKEQLRQQINTWIRSGEFDAVLDLDLLSRDPEHPTRFLPAWDSGDHLHPGDAGNRMIAEAAVKLMDSLE
ncbi:SGNH/GDSL hydrolase family protein [Paenibacillus sp. Z6-24]